MTDRRRDVRLEQLTDRVVDQLVARGYVRPARLRLRDRWEPLPWYVSGVATGLLVTLALALTVWQLTT